ncbi:MAG: L-asparaginase [Natronomonas sp.]|jgi:L-asparaginase
MTVTVISTGGTIAPTADGDEGANPDLWADDLVAAVPQLPCEIETHDFSTIPSPHFTVGGMVDLVDTIEHLDERSDVAGIVVTQGTDILEETAFFVDWCYSGATPVVFTGAMRNPSLASPDGPINLLAGVRTALTEAVGSQGVFVCLNKRVHAARDVTKVHSMNVDTFRSPERGPLGVHDEDRIRWLRRPDRTRPVLDPDPDRITNAVGAVTVTADMPPAHIPPESACAALCIAATGAGHIPPSIIPRLEAYTEADTPLVATTRCPEGRLARSTYSFEGSERTLEELGCLYSSRNLQKTRIGTIVALAADALDTVYDRPDDSL